MTNTGIQQRQKALKLKAISLLRQKILSLCRVLPQINKVFAIIRSWSWKQSEGELIHVLRALSRNPESAGQGTERMIDTQCHHEAMYCGQNAGDIDAIRNLDQ